MELGKEGAFSINVYSPGNLIAREITINGNVELGGDMQHRGFSDEQVTQALMACVGKDKVIDSKKKWAGAYWCLRWMCNYPVDIQKFCDKIDSLSIDFPAGCECSYESIRKVCTLSFFDYDACMMDKVNYSRNDKTEFFVCREVALKLAEELGKAYLPKV